MHAQLNGRIGKRRCCVRRGAGGVGSSMARDTEQRTGMGPKGTEEGEGNEGLLFDRGGLRPVAGVVGLSDDPAGPGGHQPRCCDGVHGLYEDASPSVRTFQETMSQPDGRLRPTHFSDASLD